MEFSRVYEHKSFGRIGDATLKIEGDEWTLNGTKLSSTSIEHLGNFALQTLQDAYAGATDADEAKGNFAKKLDRILKGEIGSRGEGVSGFQIVARQLMRAMLKKQHDNGKSESWKAFTALEDAEQNKKIDEKVQANLDKPMSTAEGAPTFRAIVEADIERRKRDAEAKKAITAGIDVTL